MIKGTNIKFEKFFSAPKPENTGPSPQELEDLWDTVSGELSAIFQGRAEIPADVAPFDAASEVDVDQQRFVLFHCKASWTLSGTF